MSWLFNPRPRYWVEETPELVTLALCLRKQFPRDVASLICRHVRDDDFPITWLHMWYNNPNWQKRNPLICFESSSSSVPFNIAIMGLINYPNIVEKKRQVKWLPIMPLNRNPMDLHIAYVRLGKWRKEDDEWTITITGGDIFLGLFLPDNYDPKTHPVYFRKVDATAVFDRYIEVEVRMVDDEDLISPKLVKIEKRKLWYTEYYPFHAHAVQQIEAITTKEMGDICIVNSLVEPELNHTIIRANSYQIGPHRGGCLFQ